MWISRVPADFVSLTVGVMVAAATVGEDWSAQASQPKQRHESDVGRPADWCALHFARREFKLAIEACSKALVADPADAQVYSNRGAAHLMMGDAESAIADFEAGLALMPNNAELHYNRATAHTSKGQHANAIVGYTEAIRLSPSLVPAYVNRGHAFEQLGERDKAIADYRKALELAPSLPVLRRKLQQLGEE